MADNYAVSRMKEKRRTDIKKHIKLNQMCEFKLGKK